VHKFCAKAHRTLDIRRFDRLVSRLEASSVSHAILQHMALIAASGGSLGIDSDVVLLQKQLQQFRSSGVCRLMHP
jgi:hypothetical protein